MKLRLGEAVHAADGEVGEVGEVGDVVVDRDRRTVTHLVVQPHGRHDEARLVSSVLSGTSASKTWSSLPMPPPDTAHVRKSI